uniref:Uncharacterized protein n=1 Tax=Nymphaea colorata TaxID=210225 RepID=A0A5K1B3X9_9MAGN
MIRGVKVPCQGASKAQIKVQKTLTQKPFQSATVEVSSSSNTGSVPS